MNPNTNTLSEVRKRIKDSIVLKSSYNPFVQRYEAHYAGDEKPLQIALKHSVYKTIYNLHVEYAGSINLPRLLKLATTHLAFNTNIPIRLPKRPSELKRVFAKVQPGKTIDDVLETFFTSKTKLQNAKRTSDEHAVILGDYYKEKETAQMRDAYRHLIKVCKALSLPIISYSSVKNIVRKNPQWAYSKHPELGKTLRPLGVGIKPGAPLTMVMMDGTSTVPYNDIENKTVGILKTWIVMDVFSRYPIGYSVDDSENRIMILKALEMAARTTRHLPGEIKTDNASSFKTPEWKNFKATALKYDPNILFTKHIPGQPTGKSQVEKIQELIGRKIGLDPHGIGLGVKTKNITSRKSDKSIAQILKRENLPTRAEAIKIIEEAIIKYGDTPYSEGELSARELYESIQERPYATPVGLKEIVNLFWLSTKTKISPTGQFRITVNNQKYYYILNKEDWPTLLNMKGKGPGVGYHQVIVKYDPIDMSTVHCYDPKNSTSRLFEVRKQNEYRLSSREPDDNKRDIMKDLYDRKKMAVGMINDLTQRDAHMHVHTNHFMGKEELHRSQEELLRLQFLKYNTEVSETDARPIETESDFETTVKKDRKFEKIRAL